jgi:hypothetical protein
MLRKDDQNRGKTKDSYVHSACGTTHYIERPEVITGKAEAQEKRRRMHTHVLKTIVKIPKRALSRQKTI